jgi:hypothetical protein
MFRIEMLPARQGDCLWIEYGSANDVHRVLVDGGPEGTFEPLRARVEALPPAERHLDLVVATHVDRDHVAGLIPLLQARGLGLRIDDVWFNAWQHIAPGARGPVQGEILGAVIADQALPWNRAFDGQAVVLAEPDAAPLTVTLSGGLRLTLLSPDRAALERFAPLWAKTVRAEGLEPGVPALALEYLEERPELQPPPGLRGDLRDQIQAEADKPFEEDGSLANGSSIAFLAEFEGKSCLFGADAHPTVLMRSLQRLAAAEGRVRSEVTAFKLAHHGGQHNLSPALAHQVQARHYLVSTNGSYYRHPDRPSLARVLTQGPAGLDLCFNYHSAANKVWADTERRALFGYDVRYPAAGQAGLVVEL